MDDLLDQLDKQAEWYSDGHGPLHKEAAGEIRRLRAALERIARGEMDDLASDPHRWSTTIASDALDGH